MLLDIENLAQKFGTYRQTFLRLLTEIHITTDKTDMDVDRK